MATTISDPRTFTKPVTGPPGRRYDHIFFSGTALLMLATVFVGFAPSYYLAGLMRAPLPSTIVHIHGAVFSCWILLLVVQNSLAFAGRVDIHKRLGLAGFVLASLMIVIGDWVAADRLAHGTTRPGFDPYSFYIIPATDVLIFAGMIFFAYRLRSDSGSHKRLIYIATTSLLIAAIARWPWSVVHRSPPRAALLTYAFLLLLAAYDLWSTRRVHRVTLRASAVLILIQQIRLPVGKTAAWHAFAAWVQSVVR